MTVENVAAGPRTVSRAAVINAPASELFELVADPRRHSELDGSGTVRNTVSGPARLSDSATFSVNMKQFGFPYRIKSRVTAFEEGRLIEWQHPVGHRWRWEFEPESAESTRVTESFAYETAKVPKFLELFNFPEKNGAGITATLANLQDRYPAV